MTRSKKNRLTGEDAWAAAFNAVDHQPLLDAFGLSAEPDDLRLALTHRSFANENGNLPNNERLEFLGDSVLGVSIASKLYDDYPSSTEADISKMRASIVSRFGLASVAREIGLGKHILLGKGEQANGGADKTSILADTMEALLGMFYREHGFEKTRAMIIRTFQSKIDGASTAARHDDWKTTLQERMSSMNIPVARYETSSVGPDHDRHFTAHALVGSIELGLGEGHNKKLAEQAAAEKAFRALDNNPMLWQKLHAEALNIAKAEESGAETSPVVEKAEPVVEEKSEPAEGALEPVVETTIEPVEGAKAEPVGEALPEPVAESKAQAEDEAQAEPEA